MNAYIIQFKEWFAALAPRERTLVSIAAAFTVFTILYLGVWETLANAHYGREKSLSEARALATRLEVIGAEALKARMSGGGAVSNSGMSLLSVVDQAGKSGTLSKPPTRLQPEGDREVKVWLEDTTFDGVVRWIAELETRHGVSAQTVDIEKESAPGLVNARLSLIRP